MNQFKIGDIVKFKSNGPHMAVIRDKSEYESVKCGWFDCGIYHEQWFKIATLDKVEFSK